MARDQVRYAIITPVEQMALVQMARCDRLGWHAELAEVGNEQAEDRGGAVQGPPLRPGSRHPLRALVSSIQAESARPGGDAIQVAPLASDLDVCLVDPP